jgi:hypothetical protein
MASAKKEEERKGKIEQQEHQLFFVTCDLILHQVEHAQINQIAQWLNVRDLLASQDEHSQIYKT